MEDEFDDGLESVNGSDEKQSVSSDLIRGHINTIILRALYDGDKYGYEIIAEIDRKSRGQYALKQPSLYSALKRLEKEGYITSYWGGSVSGGRRKYFSLTEGGKLISEQNQSEWEYSRTVIDSLISDKDFDFSNPPPVAVDMRVLRDSTTRARTHEGKQDDENGAELERLKQEYARQKETLERRCEELQAEISRVSNLSPLSDAGSMQQLSEEREALEEERTVFAESATRLEEAREAFEEDVAKFELEKKRYEEEMEARNDALLREREWREHEISERERKLDEEKKSLETTRKQIGEEEFRALDERLREREEELDSLRTRYEEEILERDRILEEERICHQKELESQEKKIIEEQEALFRQREHELIHRNFLDLISSPPADSSRNEYNYYNTPSPDEDPQETATTEVAEDNDFEYRNVVRSIYARSIAPENAEKVKTERATSLDGIDFHDLEAHAAQDGIRITTAGGKSKAEIAETSASVTNKGKALFVSAIVFFVFCVALGAVVLTLCTKVGIPVFFPYIIWGIALLVLLACGLAFANKYGERSLRCTTPAVINAIVLFLLLSIVALIVALSVKIDFNDIGSLATYVVVPIIFFFGIVLFGLSYYLQIRPKRD